MPDFNSFVQTELPKRPFLENDGEQGQIPIRSGVGPRQLDWRWIADLVPASTMVSGSYDFTSSLVWTVQHNKNTTKFVPTCFDESGKIFYARIVVVDVNSFEVHLTAAHGGSVNVVFM